MHATHALAMGGELVSEWDRDASWLEDGQAAWTRRRIGDGVEAPPPPPPEPPAHHHRSFALSGAGIALRTVAVAAVTQNMLNLILQWRSGLDIFVLLVALTAFWWYFVQDRIQDWTISAYDAHTRWEEAVTYVVETVTTGLVLITAQYALTFIFFVWETNSTSRVDAIVSNFALIFIIFVLALAAIDAEKLRSAGRNKLA